MEGNWNHAVIHETVNSLDRWATADKEQISKCSSTSIAHVQRVGQQIYTSSDSWQ